MNYQRGRIYVTESDKLRRELEQCEKDLRFMLWESKYRPQRRTSKNIAMDARVQKKREKIEKLRAAIK